MQYSGTVLVLVGVAFWLNVPKQQVKSLPASQIAILYSLIDWICVPSAETQSNYAMMYIDHVTPHW